MLKIISHLFTVVEVICVLVIIKEVFNPTHSYIKPFAFGLIFLFFTIDALASGKVSSRINVIDKEKSKMVYYLMTLTYLILAIVMFRYAYDLWLE